MLHFFQSKDIADYKEVFTGLQDVFENEHWPSILTWCEIISDDFESDKIGYWQVWLISEKNKTIGICGLYSLCGSDTSELWLGWLGLLPEYRGGGRGYGILCFLEAAAKVVGCAAILSYIEPGDQPLHFYQKHGFNIINHPDPYYAEHGYLVIQKKMG